MFLLINLPSKKDGRDGRNKGTNFFLPSTIFYHRGILIGQPTTTHHLPAPSDGPLFDGSNKPPTNQSPTYHLPPTNLPPRRRELMGVTSGETPPQSGEKVIRLASRMANEELVTEIKSIIEELRSGMEKRFTVVENAIIELALFVNLPMEMTQDQDPVVQGVEEGLNETDRESE